MEYIPPVLLTFLSFYFIIVVLKKIEQKALTNKIYSQFDIYLSVKPFLYQNKKVVKEKSQLDKRLESGSVDVIIVDDKAYWVLNNVFYHADFINGSVSPETTAPVDTSNMSKEDVDKMLFILDKLGDGKTNDSGSSGKQ